MVAPSVDGYTGEGVTVVIAIGLEGIESVKSLHDGKVLREIGGKGT
jgi:hypothetical protein